MTATRRTLPLWFAALIPGCREAPEVTRDRAIEGALVGQIAKLGPLVERAERGEFETEDRIVIGVSERTAKTLFDASLPQEQEIAGIARVRLESAQLFFRGNDTALLLQATGHGLTLGFKARLELAGRLANFRIDEGKLRANVELIHLTVLDTSLGDVGSNAVEALLRPYLGTLAAKIPPIEVPVRLEQSIQISGLRAGPVTVKGGVLPLAMSLAEVIPVNQRLWLLIEVKAGPWKPLAAETQP